MEDPATSITSIWTSLNSWFTSTVFFILLNLMIATILFTSNLPTNNNNNQQLEEEKEEQEQENHRHRKLNSPATADNHHHRNEPKFLRSPSILNRLKSFNFYPQRPEQEYSPETHYHLQSSIEVAATQYVFNQPIHYQHSDSDYDFDPAVTNRVPGSGTRFDSDTTRQDQEDILKQDSDDTEYGQVITDVPNLRTRFGYDQTYQDILKQDSDSGYDQVITDVPNLGARSGYDPTHNILKQDSDSEGAQLEEDDEFESLDEVYSRLKSGNVDRSNSDGAIHRKPLPPPAMKKKKKMKKSASMKVGFTHFDEEEEIVEARRPATMRERKSPAVRAAAAENDGDDDDVEVDAKADDFINKFKNDLMLQRIESIAGRSK